MLIAREMIMMPTTSEIADWPIITSFAQGLRGSVSVG